MKTFILIFRAIRRYRTALLLNVLGLSISFAVFYILLAQVSYDWNYDAFHKNADRIYRLTNYEDENNLYSPSSSIPFAKNFIKSSPHIVAGGVVYSRFDGVVVIPNDTVKIEYSTPFCYVSEDFPKVFSFEMLEGDIESIKDPQKALISLSMAEKWFGKTKDGYVGKKFGDEASWHLVVGGVYRDIPKNSEIKNAVYQLPSPQLAIYENNWSEVSFHCFVRLDDPKNVDAVLNVPIRSANPNVGEDCNTSYADEGLVLFPIHEAYFDQRLEKVSHGDRNVVILLFSIAILIVLIAGINFMNFATAVIPLRIKSINTQKVLGASTLYLRFVLVLEGVFIALIAFLLSFLWIYNVEHSTFSSFLDSDLSFRYNLPLLAMTFAVVLGVGVISSIYPTIYITSFSPALILKGSFGLSPRGRLQRNFLIGFQLVISLVMITVVLFMNLQQHYIRKFDRGFNEDQIVIVQLNYTLRNQFIDALKNNLKKNPFIEDVALSERVLGSSDSYMGWGRQKDATNDYLSFDCLPVEYNYLKVMGIDVTEGRDFREEDMNTLNGVYVFNETARKRYNLEVGQTVSNSEIVGFIPDVYFKSFRYGVTPMCFYVWGKEKWGVRDYTANIRVNKNAKKHEIRDFIRNTVIDMDPSFDESRIFFYDKVVQDLYQRELRQSFLVLLFSILSIFIAIVGVFGLILFETQARRKEIGIRKVFGASTAEILKMLNMIYIKLLLISFAISIPLSVYITHSWLQSFIVRVPLYVWVFPIALFIVGGIVVLTVTIRSWSAAKELPIKTLQSN